MDRHKKKSRLNNYKNYSKVSLTNINKRSAIKENKNSKKNNNTKTITTKRLKLINKYHIGLRKIA